jgi:hypothetical protein
VLTAGAAADVKVDERMATQALFAHLPLADASLLMYPRLYALHAMGPQVGRHPCFLLRLC